jgi:hypothetical protein
MHDIDVKVRQPRWIRRRKPMAALQMANPQRALPPGTRETPPISCDSAVAGSLDLDVSSADRSTLRTLEYSEWESRVLRPEIVVRDLDLEQVRLPAEVQSVLREIDAELRDEAESLAGQGPQAIADNVRNVAVSGASSGSSAPR